MDIPDTLIDLQRAADAEWTRLAELTDNDEREQQRVVWFEAGARAQAAITEWAAALNENRYKVEKAVREAVRHPESGSG
ncbi:hypothetical protein [Streptomyces sp. SCA2-2]|uniref:hypothetical protein n=1 Tax=Streptomyces sp. SCA2-2 TaxID=1563677 RepID=UPI0010219665|nr:hypothetical protein [Streptomyces sp. SCA2-2]RZE89201.1 hypothetical protein C0L86_29060 [Streptomyces sp. SCA2-2]